MILGFACGFTGDVKVFALCVSILSCKVFSERSIICLIVDSVPNSLRPLLIFCMFFEAVGQSVVRLTQ